MIAPQMGITGSQSLAACVLALAAAATVVLASGTRATVRLYLHLAAALSVTLALATLLSIAPRTVSWIVLPVISAALALAAKAGFRYPVPVWFATALLLLFAVVGTWVAFGGPVWFAVLPALAATVAMLVIARRGLLAGRGASILLAAGAAALSAALLAVAAETLMTGPYWLGSVALGDMAGSVTLTAPILFCTAGLLGSALAVARICDTLVLTPPKMARQERKRGD